MAGAAAWRSEDAPIRCVVLGKLVNAGEDGTHNRHAHLHRHASRRRGLPAAAGQGIELPEALFKRASQHRTHRAMAAAAAQHRPSSFPVLAIRRP